MRLFNPAELTSCDATVAFSRKVMTCTETMMNERFNTEKNEVLKESSPILSKPHLSFRGKCEFQFTLTQEQQSQQHRPVLGPF